MRDEIGKEGKEGQEGGVNYSISDGGSENTNEIKKEKGSERRKDGWKQVQKEGW